MRIPTRAVPRLALIGLLGLGLTTATVSAAVPGESALPSTTLGILKVSNVSELRASIEASQLGQLLADPAMQPLKDEVSAHLEGVNQQLRQRLGVTIEELLETPQGPAWVALVREEAEIPFAILLVADAGENQARMQEIMTKGTDQLKEQGGQVETEEFRGLTLNVIQNPEQEDAPPLVWTNEESVYYISTSTDAVKDLLANADGRDDSLADNPNFTAVQEKLSADTPVTWFVDLGQIFQVVIQASADQGNDPQQIEAMFQLLGVTGLKAVGGTYDLASGDYDSVSEIFVYAPEPTQGLLRVFQMPLMQPQPEAWVPAGVSSYQSLSWDLDAAYAALNDLANMFVPGVLQNLEQGLRGPNGEQLRFQQEIFAPLGSRITIVSDFKEPVTDESQRALFGIALDDATTFQTTLNKIIAISGATPKQRDFQGVTIYDFELPDLPMAPGAPGEGMGFDGPVSVAIAKDYLFVTSDTTLLEQILRPGAEVLADNPDYQAVASHYPNEVSSFSYNRPDEQARAVYNMVTGGQLQQALEAANMAGAQQVPGMNQAIDDIVKKVPEFSVFAKYLTQGGGYGVMSEDGMSFTQFTLRKANP